MDAVALPTLCLQKWVNETKTDICMHLPKQNYESSERGLGRLHARRETRFAVLPDSMTTLTHSVSGTGPWIWLCPAMFPVRDQAALTAVDHDARYIMSVCAVQASIGTSAVNLAKARSSIENLRKLCLIGSGSAGNIG